jgi:Immunoglobulin domain
MKMKIQTKIGAICVLMLCAAGVTVGCGGGGGSEIVAPSITTQPSSQTATAGSSVTLAVVASGTDTTYQWYKGDSAISGATSASYTINPTATSDSGTYSVVISNSAGSVTSSSVTLTVNTSTGSSSVTVN